MESSATTVVSSVASGGPAWTRLPSVTSARLTRPVIGERTLVQFRLSWAVSTAASAARTAATLLAWALVRLSNSSLRDGLHLHQLLGAGDLALGELGGGARLLELGLRPVEVGLVGAGVDLEQHLALPDLATLGEGQPLDVAGHAGPDLDLVDRLEAAAELVPLGHVALEHRGHADGGRGRRRRRLGFAADQRASEPQGTDHRKRPRRHANLHECERPRAGPYVCYDSFTTV